MAYIPTFKAGLVNAANLSNPELPSGTGPASLANIQAESPVTIASFTDGTSNTAAFGEWIRFAPAPVVAPRSMRHACRYARPALRRRDNAVHRH